MDSNYDNLKRLLDTLKTYSFWQRLFYWGRLKNQLIDATGDLQKLLINSENLNGQTQNLKQANADLSKDLTLANKTVLLKDAEIDKLNLVAQQNTNSITKLTSDFATSTQSVNDLTQRKNELELELTSIKKDLEKIEEELSTIKEQNTQLIANEENRKQEHSNQAATLKSIQDSVQAVRDKEVKDKHDAEINRLENLKFTWSSHQENVKQVIKTICKKHTIEYVDKVTFKGEPDNVIKICGEFIIFDAKSPRGDDLNNFPNYIKEQAEKVKKYAKEENVKKWIFLVIPSNTLEVIKSFVYSLADYDVFIVTTDSLEPIILSLKKIEDYDFAEQLSPEDRENICRVLGKFAHLTKRRIQIDTYFINQFIELSYKCDSDLPSDIREKAVEFEKAEKLNPPIEKRAKAINIADLEKATTKIRTDASSKGILIQDDKITDGLNEVPLYNPTSD